MNPMKSSVNVRGVTLPDMKSARAGEFSSA